MKVIAKKEATTEGIYGRWQYALYLVFHARRILPVIVLLNPAPENHLTSK